MRLRQPVRLGCALGALRRRMAGAAKQERALLNGAAPSGLCPVCGSGETRFLNFTRNVRESGKCIRCGATNRQRQMALVVRRTLEISLTGPLTPPRDCRIYSAEANGPLHQVLSAHPAYTGSEYWGEGHSPGSIVRGIRHEDLQSLSFADASLDIVLSSDVLEHVPDAYRAHQEIYRVLRSGGSHIFTVPFQDRRVDEVRAVLRRGEPVLLAAPLYHKDPVRPDQGTLVWRIFGYEMLTRLRRIGFAVGVHRLFEPRFGIIGAGAIVFVARKRW